MLSANFGAKPTREEGAQLGKVCPMRSSVHLAAMVASLLVASCARPRGDQNAVGQVESMYAAGRTGGSATDRGAWEASAGVDPSDGGAGAARDGEMALADARQQALLVEAARLILQRRELCYRADPQNRCRNYLLEVREHGAPNQESALRMIELIAGPRDAAAGILCEVIPDSRCPSTVSKDPAIRALDERFQAVLSRVEDRQQLASACHAWREAADQCNYVDWNPPASSLNHDAALTR